MDKKSFSILEKAYEAEIDGAMSGGFGILQTKSKIAKKLEDDGYLVKVSYVIGGHFPVMVTGYRLTMLGNMTCCICSCYDPR